MDDYGPLLYAALGQPVEGAFTHTLGPAEYEELCSPPSFTITHVARAAWWKRPFRFLCGKPNRWVTTYGDCVFRHTGRPSRDLLSVGFDVGAGETTEHRW